VEEVLNYVVDLKILILPEHALKFIHELLINNTVVYLFYFYDLTGASVSISDWWSHCRSWVHHVHISNSKSRSTHHAIYCKLSRAKCQSEIVIFIHRSLLFLSNPPIKRRCE
jgi:hypothetical protein